MDFSPLEMVLGGLTVALGAFLGGVTGFGYTLVATPLLLLIGFPLPFVVTANLAVASVTRLATLLRFRRYVTWQRAGALVGGSVPGLWLGTLVLTTVAEGTIKVAAGVLTMATALVLARNLAAPPPPQIPGLALLAGVGGGFLGAATSLQSIAPVLLLARDKASPRSFQADLAVFFVLGNLIGLLVLVAQDAIREDALWPTFFLWLPGSMAGNWLGTSLGPRLPEVTFRKLTLALVFVAGGITVLTA
jgi:uncharacterized membrane protein YfcA